MTAFWQGLGRAARVGLIVGLLAIVALTATLAWWTLRADYQVLFADLKPQDAAAMTAELEKLKIPYRIDEGGTAILVDKTQVHTTRLKLMGKDLPLHGAVGFELFNNTDFGMTEFAQKINYQRALQGELTRSILSLAEVKDVRVHLALPEQGLFKQPNVRPKAAITLTLREGQSLRPEQINGIQRLVAAATPGMTAQDVTVVDKQGVALTRLADEAGDPATSLGASSGNGRIELKRETETQLARKASAVLDKAFGPGQALVSVDVVLNMDQVRTTTEDVIPAPSRAGDSKGVVVKERESVRDTGREGNIPPLDAARSGNAGGSTQREVDYQVGRRVEQVVSTAGSVRRIQVVAVVRQALDSGQEEQVRRLLAAAVGALPERGDSVVVQSMRALASPEAPSTEVAALDAADHTSPPGAAPARTAKPEPVLPPFAAAIAALLVVVLALALLLHAWRRRSAQPDPSARPGTSTLSSTEREALLRQVQDWLKPQPARAGAPGGPPTGATGL